LATAQIGSGTIGMDNERGKSGLEGAFSKFYLVQMAQDTNKE
jgi:cell division protein FtsI (penicillin-binding protein 3)